MPSRQINPSGHGGLHTGSGLTPTTGGSPTGGSPTGGEPTGGEPTGGEPTGGEPTGGDTGVGVEPQFVRHISI